MPLWSSPVKTADGRVLPTRGATVCRWIEKHCVYGEGDYFGQPVRLRAWQKRWFKRLYEYYPETGRRRYRRAFKGVAKGNGKTPEAAFIGAYEFLGGLHLAPRVIIGAASLKQANLVFGDLKTTVTESPTLRDYVLPYELEIQLADGQPGVAERIAAEAGTNDGARATCFIADELHEWTGRRARVFMIVDGAVTKRQDAFVLAISTAGVRNESDLLWENYEKGCRIASGEEVDDSFLFEWFEAPGHLDLEDEKQWLEAVEAANPAAGDFLDVESIRDRFRSMPRYEWERYHLNRWTTTERMWLPSGAWDGQAAARPVKPGTEITVGFDGSYNNDATALVGCTLDGYVFVLGAWEKPAGDDSWIVPRIEVEGRIASVFRDYRVVRMACDPPGWHREIEEWAQKYGEEVVIGYPTSNRVRMSQACSKFYTGVVTGQISHDADPRLARHLANAVLKETEDGAYIRKEGRASPRKIDLAVAAVLAYDQATTLQEKPKEVAQLRTF